MTGNDTADFAIVGAGVVGLAIAWRIAQRGASVIVLEQGKIGSGASGAAAGMLAPCSEAKTRGPFSDLGMESLRRYPGFIDELTMESGIDSELVRTGLLRVAEGGSEAELRDTFGAMREMGSRAEWVDCAGVRKLEPALSPDITAAIFSPTEWRVEPSRMVCALATAAGKRGARICQNRAATGFITNGSAITGVKTLTGDVSAGKVVVAGGSWNQAIAEQLGARIPITPIRGQIAALGPFLPKPLQYTIYSQHGYLVPKADGRIFVGSTEDDAGFAACPTAAGIADILGRAVALAPVLANAPLAETWAGLRPLSADRMPVLGRLAGWDNAFVAAGHFRNGILLTPITGDLMASLLLEGKNEIDPAFCPDRFMQ